MKKNKEIFIAFPTYFTQIRIIIDKIQYYIIDSNVKSYSVECNLHSIDTTIINDPLSNYLTVEYVRNVWKQLSIEKNVKGLPIFPSYPLHAFLFSLVVFSPLDRFIDNLHEEDENFSC